jgi:hypothetical protein
MQIQEAEREISCYAAAVSRLEAEQQGAGEGGTSGPGEHHMGWEEDMITQNNKERGNWEEGRMRVEYAWQR